eukprot:gb/GFBE01083644.1/.p1 GENE.gb/GFBE01083644.1/~~gb/GFBE01083644.1/.p1  ORF type:complete len:127 (+),score=24.76 gb/GFBE01083644.1/:1-381(+)
MATEHAVCQMPVLLGRECRTSSQGDDVLPTSADTAKQGPSALPKLLGGEDMGDKCHKKKAREPRMASKFRTEPPKSAWPGADMATELPTVQRATTWTPEAAACEALRAFRARQQRIASRSAPAFQV